MAWIESHQDLRDHPKTKRTARLLHIDIPKTIGHLHILWWWALAYAEDGDLSGFEEVEVAEAAMWRGDPHKFCSALIDSGFLCQTPDGTLTLHDWWEYAGKLVERRRQDAARKKQTRQKTSVGRPMDVRTPSVVTEHNTTVPNLNGLADHSKDRDWEADAEAAVGRHKDSMAVLIELVKASWPDDRLGRGWNGRIASGLRDFGVVFMAVALLEVRDENCTGNPLDLVAKKCAFRKRKAQQNGNVAYTSNNGTVKVHKHPITGRIATAAEENLNGWADERGIIRHSFAWKPTPEQIAEWQAEHQVPSA